MLSGMQHGNIIKVEPAGKYFFSEFQVVYKK